MKKKYVLIILGMFFCFVIKAQTPYTGYIPFPEDSAQWSVWHLTDNGATVSSIQYKMKGDTILNGVSYNKIYKSYLLNYSANDTLINCFIRQDTVLKTVYIRYPFERFGDTNEYLLYDFKIKMGDTIWINILPNNIIYPIAIVYKDTVQYNYDYRIEIEAQVVDTCGLPYCLWGFNCDSFSLTEGIGNSKHPFYCEIPKDGCFFGQSYNLECFWHKGKYIFGGSFCDYSTGIKSNNDYQSELISVFPNPAENNSLINFESKSNIIKRIELYDILGNRIKIVQDLSTNKAQLKNDNFICGMYFYKVFLSNEENFYGKIIIE